MGSTESFRVRFINEIHLRDLPYRFLRRRRSTNPFFIISDSTFTETNKVWSSIKSGTWNIPEHSGIYQLRCFKRSTKIYFVISMKICRIAVRSWHRSLDILPISCEAWRLLLAGNFLAQVRSLLISGFIQWRSTLALYLAVRCSFYPSLFTVVYCISV